MEFTVSLEQQASVLSMEAFNVKASLQAVTRVFPSFARAVKEKLMNFGPSDVPSIPAVETLNIAKLKKVNFVAHRKTPIYGPLGVKVTYLEYLDAVGASVDIVTKLQVSQLGALNQWANGLLSEPERFNSARGDKPNLPYNEGTILECRGRLEKCVDRASTQTLHEYGKLFRNNGEVVMVTTQVNELIARYMSVDRELLIQSVEDSVNLLERLADRLENDKSFKPNGATLSELTKGILDTAKLVEFYSITGYLLAEVRGTIHETIKGIERLV